MIWRQDFLADCNIVEIGNGCKCKLTLASQSQVQTPQQHTSTHFECKLKQFAADCQTETVVERGGGSNVVSRPM